MKTTTRNAAGCATLVQSIEVWSLADDGETMRLDDEVHWEEGASIRPVAERSVRSGEGMVGMAWKQRDAIILNEGDSVARNYSFAADTRKPEAWVAYPVLVGHDVQQVIVLGIAPGPGAFELWSRDDRDEVSVSASYYVGLKSFEFISRYVRFPRGAGLPGTVWKTGQPKLVSNLSQSPGFMRSFAADETELNIGLGLPIGGSTGTSGAVLLLLSSPAKPIAVGFEIWQPMPAAGAVANRSPGDGSGMTRVAADWTSFNVGQSPVGTSSATADIVAQACRTSRPVLTAATSGASTSATRSGGVLRALLAMPVFESRELTAVVVLAF